MDHYNVAYKQKCPVGNKMKVQTTVYKITSFLNSDRGKLGKVQNSTSKSVNDSSIELCEGPGNCKLVQCKVLSFLSKNLWSPLQKASTKSLVGCNACWVSFDPLRV